MYERIEKILVYKHVCVLHIAPAPTCIVLYILQYIPVLLQLKLLLRKNVF